MIEIQQLLLLILAIRLCAAVLVHYYSWSWSHCLNYYRTLSTGVVIFLNTRGGERPVDLAFAEHAPGFFSASFFL